VGKRRSDAGRQATTFGNLTRSLLMARIRCRGNRSTEARLAAELRVHGVTGWRRHVNLPGRPDFSWSSARVAVFVDGCFWHGHHCKELIPRTNVQYWMLKIACNTRRDAKVTRRLRQAGWSVLRIWECKLRKHPVSTVRRVARALGHRSEGATGPHA